MRNSDREVGIRLTETAAERAAARAITHEQTATHLCGDDPDAQWQMLESSGEEASCGSAMTPDQNVVDNFGDAFGIRYDSNEALSCGVKEYQRDRHRWELNPASSEDYQERVTPDGHRSMKWRHFGH